MPGTAVPGSKTRHEFPQGRHEFSLLSRAVKMELSRAIGAEGHDISITQRPSSLPPHAEIQSDRPRLDPRE
jgi:hypothetical protein